MCGNCTITSAFRKYGIDNFHFLVIEEVEQDKLDEREIFWIKYFKANDPVRGYNRTEGGSTNRGLKMSEASKEKMSRRKIQFFKDHPEAKRRIIANMRSKPPDYDKVSKKLREKYANKPGPTAGNKLSSAHKSKISKSLKGRKYTAEMKEKYKTPKVSEKFERLSKKVGKFDDLNNLIKVYPSINKAHIEENIPRSNIQLSIKKHSKLGEVYWKII